MKYWEVCKKENLGKSYETTEGKLYKVKLRHGKPVMTEEDGIEAPFSQSDILDMNFSRAYKKCSFMDAINSGKKRKVRLKVMEEKLEEKTDLMNFHYLKNVWYYLGQLSSEESLLLIKYGSWFIEE